MSKIEQIKLLLSHCSPSQREEVFRHLREEFSIHPLEMQLHAKAEIVLEAIQRTGGLTLRMIKGVIAEAAFDVDVVEQLQGWWKVSVSGDPPYDFRLRDRRKDVRVQVKLQRSKEGRPMRANEAYRSFPEDMYVVETQKTRRGTKGKNGKNTRPYRFGEFDLLAVSMYPSTERWDTFMYTVADWLLPGRNDPAEILKFQPVARTANEDWSDDFQTAVGWLRSRDKKTIRSV